MQLQPLRQPPIELYRKNFDNAFRVNGGTPGQEEDFFLALGARAYELGRPASEAALTAAMISHYQPGRRHHKHLHPRDK